MKLGHVSASRPRLLQGLLVSKDPGLVPTQPEPQPGTPEPQRPWPALHELARPRRTHGDALGLQAPKASFLGSRSGRLDSRPRWLSRVLDNRQAGRLPRSR